MKRKFTKFICAGCKKQFLEIKGWPGLCYSCDITRKQVWWGLTLNGFETKDLPIGGLNPVLKEK